MASFEHRIPDNIPGKFYVDDQCIYCDLCREIAPSVFRQQQQRDGQAFVFHQPSTPEELRAAIEAFEGCPYDAIGADGEGQAVEAATPFV